MEAMPPSFIDTVEQALGGMDAGVHAVSEANLIRIIDTPHVWGRPMTSSGVSALAAQSVQDMAGIVESIIAGANQHVDIVSLNPPLGVFQKAVENGLAKLAQRIGTAPITIRFLFGYVMLYDTVTKFQERLATFCKENKLPVQTMTILVGQLSTSLAGASWNHAKIVAADGSVALVGGHNLWDGAYGSYPPVHDISVEVRGGAAAHAQQFAEFLWRKGENLLIVKRINQSFALAALAAGTARDQVTLTHPAVPQTQVQQEGGEGWAPGRVLSLGRGGVLGQNASDVAKEQVIKGARSSLYICQQDLMFTGANKEREHLVCHWIAEALLASDTLKVNVVVSPLDAAGGGQQYSWGNGASGTNEFLRRLITEKAASKTKAGGANERLAVAPFCFNEVKFTAEGTDYKWPDPPSGSRCGRMGTVVPTPAIFSSDPAPGNHAKVYIADESCYYVGSDNLYPHNLMEFGYLVEGKAATDLVRDYWNQVWAYSAPHAYKK
ncbi:hypothetical protein J4573_35405 [Actinomadura barringtoniae]|uniref:PLD phosphodiesterase domain-containing protein n=1 Tax=Actinomadura barringtoniae TaxID=1427535 RepID=A0A939T6W0_9ACTN|nr:hypothetical protein [Actinomadura barringtoniae]MBO2452423.1 hypothetical protein [Actinomadura barringtoniae]